MAKSKRGRIALTNLPRACARCGAHFMPRTWHAITCGPVCKALYHRDFVSNARYAYPEGPPTGHRPPARAKLRWTSEEDKRLLADYPVYGPTVTAQRLGRPLMGVNARMVGLRKRDPRAAAIHLKPGCHTRGPFRPYAMATARALYELEWPTGRIARAVGVSQETVNEYAKDLGWERPRTLSPNQIGAILGRTGSTVLYWRNRGWVALDHLGPGGWGFGMTEAELLAWLAEPAHVTLWTLADVREDWRARAAEVRPAWVALAELERETRVRDLRRRVGNHIREGLIAHIVGAGGMYAVRAEEAAQIARRYGGWERPRS